MSPLRFRPPVSARHAFALAFALAVRRDPLQSLLVPLVLQAPWILALGVLPPIAQSSQPTRVLMISVVAQIGAFIVWLIVSASLRFRARSVFNTPSTAAPAPAAECYTRGLTRVPWLLLTEIVRNLALLFATFFFVLPALFLGFRLAFATEAVVLKEPHLAGAFQRSFRLTEGRFERWFEMIVVSVTLVFAAILLGAILSVAVPGPSLNTWVAATQLLIVAILPVIQYAWTFFYLRLEEVEEPESIEVGPAYAAAALPHVAAADGGGAEPHDADAERGAPAAETRVAAPEPPLRSGNSESV